MSGPFWALKQSLSVLDTPKQTFWEKRFTQFLVFMLLLLTAMKKTISKQKYKK